MQVVQQVAAKFGRNDVRTIKFVARKRSVKVTCKGFPKMIIKPREGDGYEAFVTLPNGMEEFVTARTPKAAYRLGIRQLWK